MTYGDDRLPAHFWNKVRTDAETGCWFWTGYVMGDGYGQLKILGKTFTPHRVAYQKLVGPIPQGLTVDHLCHNAAAAQGLCHGGSTCVHRSCVNPAHLEVVTQGENGKRSVLVLTTIHALKAECPRGHAYDEGNTYCYVSPVGYVRRCCRACNRDAVRRSKLRRAAS